MLDNIVKLKGLQDEHTEATEQYSIRLGPCMLHVHNVTPAHDWVCAVPAQCRFWLSVLCSACQHQYLMHVCAAWLQLHSYIYPCLPSARNIPCLVSSSVVFMQTVTSVNYNATLAVCQQRVHLDVLHAVYMMMKGRMYSYVPDNNRRVHSLSTRPKQMGSWQCLTTQSQMR
jgi:hypothetical protein